MRVEKLKVEKLKVDVASSQERPVVSELPTARRTAAASTPLCPERLQHPSATLEVIGGTDVCQRQGLAWITTPITKWPILVQGL